jgi:hypothetical protein
MAVEKGIAMDSRYHTETSNVFCPQNLIENSFQKYICYPNSVKCRSIGDGCNKITYLPLPII